MPRFQVAKSIEIDASPEQVFDTVADYRTWPQWSPWLCVEPDAQVTVSDDPNSVGSTYAWEGELVGAGELRHLTLERGRSIQDAIRFHRPFRSSSSVSFSMEPAAAGTQLTWEMSGSLPWFLFFMCSQMKIYIGMDYERGLRMLKEYIETGRVVARTVIRGVENVGPLRLAGIRKTCSFEDIAASMGTAMGEAVDAFNRLGLPFQGMPMTAYHRVDLNRRTFDYTSGFTLPDEVRTIPAELSSVAYPAIRAMAVEHHGRYEHLGNSWNAGYHVIRTKRLKLGSRPAFEFYLNDPSTTPTEELRTDIYIPVR